MSYINSVGVKNWIEWVTRIPSHLKIYFDHCVPAIVNQINSVTGFLPKNGTVRSFYVPYNCDNCGREERILVQDGKEYEFGNPNKTLQIPDEIPCPKCKSNMEIDILASRYFGFLKGS